MAITKPKNQAKQKRSADDFIAGAPDGGEGREARARRGRRKGVMRGRKEQISVTLAPELIDRLDALAAAMGQSRAALVGLAVYRFIEQNDT